MKDKITCIRGRNKWQIKLVLKSTTYYIDFSPTTGEPF